MPETSDFGENPPRDPEAQLKPGDKLIDQEGGLQQPSNTYEIQFLAGRGGSNEVYKAHDTKLNRSVALKVAPYLVWDTKKEGFYDLGLFVAVGNKVPASSRAALFFDGQSIPSGAKIARASSWLVQGKYHRETTLQEESIALPKYNAVLTLLWVDEDIDDEDFY